MILGFTSETMLESNINHVKDDLLLITQGNMSKRFSYHVNVCVFICLPD